MLDHLRKLNEELTAKPEADRKGASPLTADELKHLDSLATLLNDVNTYHLSTIAPAQYAAVCKLLLYRLSFWRGIHITKYRTQKLTVYHCVLLIVSRLKRC